MIEISRDELLQEVYPKRPDSATLFEEMLFYVKASEYDGATTTLRFDNGYGAVVYTPNLSGTNYFDTVYAVTWPASASSIKDYDIASEPLEGRGHLKYESYEELRAILRKIQAYPPPAL